MLLDLLKKTEIHKCDKCDHEHEVETGILEPEQFEKLLKEENGE